jgi:hypothetical protein
LGTTILQAALVGDLSLGSRYLGFASAMVPELVVMVMYISMFKFFELDKLGKETVNLSAAK